MLSKTCNDQNFNNTFKEIEHTETLELSNNNCLKIYTLPMANNRFDYNELKNLIKDNIKNYVFSRNKVNEAIKNNTGDRLIWEAIEKFRKIKDNDDKGKGGELGEILLYIFLENQLNAKKILSKMELKTSRNDYVKGADGVFLYSYLKNQIEYFDFIIGEAKLQDKISDAIDNAFKSINAHMEVESFEYNLVNDNIFKETVSEEEAEELKKIIVPGFNNESFRNDAFGIFIGYTLKVNLNNIPYEIAKEKVSKEILDNIHSIKDTFNKKIKEYQLSDYSFYVYVLPFNKVSDDRADIMNNILLGG